MKEFCLQLHQKVPHIFISHMVQMKENNWINAYFCAIDTLYPTWFRWKWVADSDYHYISQVFISHMVQMKAASSLPYYHLSSDFISHMVQMKGDTKGAERWSQITLYPTWFRWKSCCPAGAEYFTPSLYPTWFRWKLSRRWMTVDHIWSLYIPHGSDESFNILSCLSVIFLFISHMVQMKEKCH